MRDGEREKERRRKGDEGHGEKGDGSYQQVFNDQLREPK